ncbi:hypothetical protein [Acidiluteibacter ferrifornacis]|uniref:Uncharacterized protein n=1 Tax=Acidiluteibacter ferrifornacis TaxID=2692424 RepID=A0A6N9NK30_9FLAO|nr:hypothetical protein [Acidiluteibacter ferrifornacis]NBG65527.1 hypothetical protein [Acidiluteibacter ferrifornacis]
MKTTLLTISLLLSMISFAQTKKKSSVKTDKTLAVKIDPKVKTIESIHNYMVDYLNRNVEMAPTFRLDTVLIKNEITKVPDSLLPNDSIRFDTTILGTEARYYLYTDSNLIDSISFYLDHQFNVIDSQLVKLGYAIQLANGELTSLENAKVKVLEEYPDAIWNRITLKRGKVEHYNRKGYELGQKLTYYYFDGICKTCSYQIIKIQFDAETGKVASELKIKTD